MQVPMLEVGIRSTTLLNIASEVMNCRAIPKPLMKVVCTMKVVSRVSYQGTQNCHDLLLA